MIRQIQYVMAAILLNITACATSDPEMPDPAANNGNLVTSSEGTAVVADEDEIICRKEKKAGSRLKVRVCRTRLQIEEEREVAQRLLRETGLRGSGGIGSE